MLKDEDVQCLNNQPTTNNQQRRTTTAVILSAAKDLLRPSAGSKIGDRRWGRQEILHVVKNDRRGGVQNGGVFIITRPWDEIWGFVLRGQTRSSALVAVIGVFGDERFEASPREGRISC